MAFCANLRELGVFMFASNRLEFGHLVNPETFDITRTEPDMYQIIDNQRDWETRYIHPEYPENFNPEKKAQQVRFNNILYSNELVLQEPNIIIYI